MADLSSTLKGSTNKAAKRSEPVWQGPMSKDGGITQSLLSRFLVCRERFRLLVIEGLKPIDDFNKNLEYGNMWHICEEGLAFGHTWEEVMKPLTKYALKLCKQYPLKKEEIDKWYNVCKVQFPVYVTYWAMHPDVRKREPILQEYAFNVPYALPSGRSVFLRGKFDSVDLINGGIWLQENKTKSEIDEVKIRRQLTFDLQTMFYLIALRGVKDSLGLHQTATIKGVRYNVIRRPLSGGKGTIKQHQPTKSNPAGESKEAFFARLRDDYIAAEPETYFARWEVPITDQDIKRFKMEFLDPILEQLCDWWQAITKSPKCEIWSGASSLNWRHPFGVYNVLDEGGSSDLDAYLESGSMVGLQRTENLFPELS